MARERVPASLCSLRSAQTLPRTGRPGQTPSPCFSSGVPTRRLAVRGMFRTGPDLLPPAAEQLPRPLGLKRAGRAKLGGLPGRRARMQVAAQRAYANCLPELPPGGESCVVPAPELQKLLADARCEFFVPVSRLAAVTAAPRFIERAQRGA